MNTLAETIEKHFLLIALVLSAAALAWPAAFAWIAPHIPYEVGMQNSGRGAGAPVLLGRERTSGGDLQPLA